MTTPAVCLIEPFRYQATPQSVGEEGASSNQINEQHLEDYLSRLRTALCEDIEALQAGETTSSFLDLTDTPDSYAGAAGQQVVVNDTETGLEFQDDPEGTSVERMMFLAVHLGTNLVTANTNFLGYGGAVGINGTVGFAAIAAGAVRTGIPRRNIISAGGAGSTSAYKSSGALIYRGANPREGGFRFVAYFGTATAVAQQRAFFGVSASAGIIGNVNPSTLVNIFGVGYDSAETVFSLLHNDSGGSATKTPLGTDFPVNATDFFKLEIIAEPNDSEISYTFTNLTTGNVSSGSVNADLPVDTTFLNGQLWCNNGTTALAVTMEFTSILLEMRI